MFVPFLIMLREGLEAALIVSLIASYLKRTQRGNWIGVMWIGVILAAALCLGLGIFINETTGEFPQREQELFEGIVAVIAVVILTWMVFWMRNVSRNVKQQLEQAEDEGTAQALLPAPTDSKEEDGHHGQGDGTALGQFVQLQVGQDLCQGYHDCALTERSDGTMLCCICCHKNTSLCRQAGNGRSRNGRRTKNAAPAERRLWFNGCGGDFHLSPVNPLPTPA